MSDCFVVLLVASVSYGAVRAFLNRGHVGHNRPTEHDREPPPPPPIPARADRWPRGGPPYTIGRYGEQVVDPERRHT